MPPANTHITADQDSTLVEYTSIATHHGGDTGDTDGRARDAKHGEPPAYKGDFVGACSVGAGRRIG